MNLNLPLVHEFLAVPYPPEGLEVPEERVNVLVTRSSNDKTKEGYNVDNLEYHISNIKGLPFLAGTRKKHLFSQKSFLQCVIQLKNGESYMGIKRLCDLRYTDWIGLPMI